MCVCVCRYRYRYRYVYIYTHLALLLGVLVLEEFVDVRDHVEGQRGCAKTLFVALPPLAIALQPWKVDSVRTQETACCSYIHSLRRCIRYYI